MAITTPPSIDETPNPGESAKAISLRLATEKAQIISNENKGAVVIGSDQVALCEDEIIGKPGSEKKAKQQKNLNLQQRKALLQKKLAKSNHKLYKGDESIYDNKNT